MVASHTPIVSLEDQDVVMVSIASSNKIIEDQDVVTVPIVSHINALILISRALFSFDPCVNIETLSLLVLPSILPRSAPLCLSSLAFSLLDGDAFICEHQLGAQVVCRVYKRCPRPPLTLSG